MFTIPVAMPKPPKPPHERAFRVRIGRVKMWHLRRPEARDRRWSTVVIENGKRRVATFHLASYTPCRWDHAGFTSVCRRIE